MIPYSKQTISSADIKQVITVMKSKFLTQGNYVQQFEKGISKYVKSKYAVAVSSASAGLHLACLALNLNKKDLVWTVPNSFIASASCALHCGSKIDFVDIDRETKNMSYTKLRKKLEKIKKKSDIPKAIVTVHFAGQPTEQEKIFQLSKKFGFKIIEDASHSLGASRLGEKVGSCRWSDLTVFSFHPVKPITTAEGGIITTNNKKYFEKLKLLRNHGISRDYKKLKVKSNWYYEQTELGFNYRMNEIQSALGISQLKKIDLFNKYRNKSAKYYFHNLKNLPIQLPVIDKSNYSSFHLFVISFRKIIQKKYDSIYKEFLKKKIGVNLHYLPIHLHPFFKNFGFKKGDFPESEIHAQTSFSLPLYYGIKKKEQKKVVNIIKNICSKF